MNAIDQIHKHRSIRKYKPEPVPEETLEKILAAGVRASSSGNMQSYSIILTQEEERRQALSIALGNHSMVLEAPTFVTFCADFHRMRRWLTLRDAPDNFDSFLAFMVGAIDAILVSQNVALAAESEGLGICYLGGTLVNCDQVGKTLHLPQNVVPVVGFCLGYPDEDPALRHRLPLDGLVHEERYHEYTEENIHSIYHKKEEVDWQRYMQSTRLRALVEKHGVENLAQLYTELKYTREPFQEYSRQILDYLEEQGFMNNRG
jgi:nitroreductase